MRFNKLFIPILSLLIFLFLVANRVNKIDCFVANNTCPQELIENSTILKGSSFFFGNFKEKLHENLLENNIYILQSITKKFPGTLILKFVQEEIEYSILLNNETKFIGKSGTLIPNNSETKDDLVIEWKIDNSLIEENKVNGEYHKLFLVLARFLGQTTRQSQRIVWNSNEEIILDIPGKPQFIFDLETIETHIKKVDTIISAREIDEIEEPILEIDMRFDLPVLRTRQ